MAKTVKKCRECGACDDDAAVGDDCPNGPETGCEGVIVEVVWPEKEKKTRRKNPLRWARGLDRDRSPRKLVEAMPYLLEAPQMWGPEHATPSIAHKWLGENGEEGYDYDLARITERGISGEVTRQFTLIQRTDDGAYVTIGKAVRS